MTTRPKPPAAKSSQTATAQPHLPDPATPGPYRPFTTDPHWNEAWWWLGFPILVTLFVIISFRAAPDWYDKWVIPEGYGVLELSQFIILLLGLAIAVRLLFKPFVRKRPFVLAVTIVGAMTCLYTAGEEMSWGQHFFHWNTPEYWALVNRQQETNLHNTYAVFEKWPRAVLETGIAIGGLFVPLAAAFFPVVRANRLSLFLPAAAVVPTAIAVFAFKFADMLYARKMIEEVVGRPSETVELYLYYFILGYLIVYARRIRELEAPKGATPK
jgi:hypothetical protein